MISRSSVARLALRQARSAPVQARGFAAAATGSPSFETYDAAGIKVASRDAHGPTSKIALVVKAGTRYQPLPGLTVGLEEFAFKNTSKRSALRITRESELLGGRLNAYHTREALVLEAAFLRQDVPYFTELLAEVLTETRYTTHEFHEDIETVMSVKQAKLFGNPVALALDGAHSVAFHNGLGAPVYPSTLAATRGYLDEYSIASFAESAYTKPNIALIADGASQSTLTQWTDKFFKSVPASTTGGVGLKSTASKYYGGEQRTEHSLGNALVIAFPGSSKPEVAVLASLLGGQSSVKWSPGFSLLSKVAASSGATASATNLVYSDAGLLAIQLSGSAQAVRLAAEETVKVLQAVAKGTVSSEDLTKAIARAKFDALDKTQSTSQSMLDVGTALLHGAQPTQAAELIKTYDGVTAASVQSLAKSLLEGRASVSAVGDLHVLPFAEDLGLKI